MTNWFQFLLISHPRLPQKSALEHPIESLTEAQYGRETDALEARQLEEEAHSVAFDVFRENFDANASSHHKTRTEGLMSLESRPQRIERMMNLDDQ
jgi:hypothetical protein